MTVMLGRRRYSAEGAIVKLVQTGHSYAIPMSMHVRAHRERADKLTDATTRPRTSAFETGP